VVPSNGGLALHTPGHDESIIGTSCGALRLAPSAVKGGRGVRTSGPWPQCGHWVMSMPVRCRIHATALGASRGDGWVGWPSKCRPWRRGRA
jgi:hypothetical protein